MKKINTSNVTSTSRQPFLGRSVTHLVESVKEGDDSIVQGIIQDTAKATILWGLTNSTPGGATYTLTAGGIYFGGEVYSVDAQTVTVTGANRLVAKITTTYQGGDPVTMTDGTLKNVHEIRKIVFSDAASGSGDFDFGYISGVYVDAIDVIDNLKAVPVVQTATSNGLTITANNVSGTFGYTTDVYAYSYYILHNICHLSFKITFTVSGAGATIDKLRIPLPTGISKATTGGETYSQRGTWAWKAPTGTTDYAMGLVYANDDGTEGQRLVLYRSEGGDDEITASVVATEVTGFISFPLA
jgi:hypothetical protein